MRTINVNRNGTCAPRLICATLMWIVACSSNGVACAHDEIVTFNGVTRFEDYPQPQRAGDEGHRIVASCFTGEWYCALIGAGVIGNTSPPFSRLPITKERMVAIVAVEMETGTAKCLTIKAPLQTSQLDLRVRSKERIWIVLKGNGSDQNADEYVVADVNLSKETVVARQMPLPVLEEQIAIALPDELIATSRRVGKTGLGTEAPQPPQILINGASRFIDLDVRSNPTDTTRIVWTGSRRDRVIECQILGSGRLSVSERETDGRVLWLLSEGTFGPVSSNGESSISHIYLPGVQVAPLSRVVLIAERMDGMSSTQSVLFEIVGGRAKAVKSFAPGSKLVHLSVSESECFAGIELDTGGKDHVLIGIDLETDLPVEFADHTEDEGYLAMIGITNSGSLVQEGGATVYLTRPSKKPQLVYRLLTERKRGAVGAVNGK